MRIGIIGTGRIACRFVPECQAVDGIGISAIYNPHEGSARQFVDKLWHDKAERGVEGNVLTPAATDDIGQLLEMTEAVYIASPHETHYHYIIQALEHGKHVLCEKPMVLKEKEAQEVFLIAKNHGLVLMEAIKTAYCPGYKKLIEVARSGVIGDVKYIESRFTKLENPDSRELNDTKYGGSFTELGSYVCLPILELFGSGYMDIRFSSINNGKGLDIFTKAEFTYGDKFASAICGLGVKSEGNLMISGTEGYIKVDAPWWKTSHFEVHFEDPSKAISYDEDFEGDGLRYEISEFVRRTRPHNGGGCGGGLNERSRACAIAAVVESFYEKRNRMHGK